MRLTSQSAINMTSIIITETQGEERLARQLPLTAVDQNDRWLVHGNPYEDSELALNYCQFYVLFKKDSAEIVGMGSEASMKIGESTKRDTLRYVTKDRFDDAFGPRNVERLSGSNLGIALDFAEIFNGGIINSHKGAIDDAYNLIQSSPHSNKIAKDTLSAEERAGVWCISRKNDKTAYGILNFDRLTGRVLSINL